MLYVNWLIAELGRGMWYEAQYRRGYRSWTPRAFVRSAPIALLWQAAVRGSVRSPGDDTDELIDRIAISHSLTADVLRTKTRKRAVIVCKYEAIRAVKNLRPNMSSVQIARRFNMDHTSVLYALGTLTSRKPSYYANCGGNMRNLKNFKEPTNDGEIRCDAQPDGRGSEPFG